MKIFGRLVPTPSQMSCRQVAKVLQSYLDHELDDRSAAKVAAHLDECRRCGLEAETYEELKAVLRRGPSGAADGSVARLRDFGERLARGDTDPGGRPAS